MGCGGSVAQKQQLKIIPVNPQVQNIPFPKDEEPKEEKIKTEQKNTTIDKINPPAQSSARKQAPNKPIESKSLEKDIAISTKAKNSAKKSSPNINLTDSSITKRNDLSLSKGREEQKQSSTNFNKEKGKLELKGKQEVRSSKGKLSNPEMEGLLKQQVLVKSIKEEDELKKTKPKKETTHSVKKMKSVKNNKELADLIKIYAL